MTAVQRLLSSQKEKDIDSLYEKYSTLDSDAKALKSDSVTLPKARAYFDKVISLYPELSLVQVHHLILVDRTNFKCNCTNPYFEGRSQDG